MNSEYVDINQSNPVLSCVLTTRLTSPGFWFVFHVVYFVSCCCGDVHFTCPSNIDAVFAGKSSKAQQDSDVFLTKAQIMEL